jgi:hypothetical protein
VTCFLNFRGGSFGALISEPIVFSTSAAPSVVRPLTTLEFSRLIKGQDLVFVTHGFNVGYADGVRSIGNLDQLLGPVPGIRIGVLWPGDWVIPAINYPFAVGIARDCGKHLGAFVSSACAAARSVSFLSHSLGARVVLEAAGAAGRPVRLICLLAAAVNSDCLTGEYAETASDTASIINLASGNDLVLKLAYPAGDFLADLLDLDHRPFEKALGSYGPVPNVPTNTRAFEIGDQTPYDHGDYLPPAHLPAAEAPPGKFQAVVTFLTAALSGIAPAWPP